MAPPNKAETQPDGNYLRLSGCMLPEYRVIADVGRSYLQLTLSGFFDVETVAALAAERNQAVARFRCGANQHLTLCDAREAMLSTPEVNEVFRRLLGDPRYASRRLAYVTKQALGRIQAGRVLARDNIAYFTDIAAGEAWLFADEPSAAQRA